MEQLADLKIGKVSEAKRFVKTAERDFTPHYKKMVHCVGRLHKVVFPDGKRWRTEDNGLYARMKEILRGASKEVAG